MSQLALSASFAPQLDSGPQVQVRVWWCKCFALAVKEGMANRKLQVEVSEAVRACACVCVCV